MAARESRGRGRGRGQKPGGGAGRPPMRQPHNETVAKVLQDVEDDQFSNAQEEGKLPAQITHSQDSSPTVPATHGPQPPQRSDNWSQVGSVDETKQQEEKVHSSEMASQLKSALKEGAKVISPLRLNPNSPEFTPCSSSPPSFLNPTAQPFTPTLPPSVPPSNSSSSTYNPPLFTKALIMSPTSQNTSQTFVQKVPSPGTSRSLNVAAPEFFPKIGLPIMMQNGDLPSPSGDEFESANFSIQPEDELPILKVEDILRGFERVAKPSQDDDGGDMLLKSSADMLLKATMYPASYDRLKKRLQTTVKAWPPSEATMANLAEMLVHWGILEPGLRYTASRICETLLSDTEMNTRQFRKQLLQRLHSSYEKQKQSGGGNEQRENLINLSLFFADVFARIKVEEQPVAILGAAIFELISLLLMIKEDSAIMGACNVLKLTGSLLETCTNAPEKMKAIITTLRSLSAENPTPLSSRCIELMLLVVELRAAQWGKLPFRVPPSQQSTPLHPFLFDVQPTQEPSMEEMATFEYEPIMLQAPVTNPEDWNDFLDDTGAVIEETDTAGFVFPEEEEEEAEDDGLDPEIREAMEAFLDELDRDEMMQEFCPEEDGEGVVPAGEK